MQQAAKLSLVSSGSHPAVDGPEGKILAGADRSTTTDATRGPPARACGAGEPDKELQPSGHPVGL